MPRTSASLVSLLSLLLLAPSASAQDVRVLEGTRGGAWGLDHHPISDGSVSLLAVTGRFAVGQRELDTRYQHEEVIAGRRHLLTDTGTSTFLVRRDRAGRPLVVESIRIDGGETELRSQALPGGDLLVFGSARVDHRFREVAVARVNANGQLLWSWRSTHRPPSSCDPRQRLCRFATSSQAYVSGDAAWINLGFRAGELELPGGHRVRGRRYLNNATVALDLRTGAVRWAQARPGQTASVLQAGELVSAQDRGSRYLLHHYDPSTGRRLRSTTVSAPSGLAGMVLELSPHAGGYLLQVLRSSDQRDHLIGLDANGQHRFDRPMAVFTKMVSEGGFAHLMEPISTGRRTVRGSSNLYAEGLRLTSIDAAGRVVAQRDLGGLWDIISLRLGRSSGAYLSGLLTDASGTRFVAAPVSGSTVGPAAGLAAVTSAGPTLSLAPAAAAPGASSVPPPWRSELVGTPAPAPRASAILASPFGL